MKTKKEENVHLHHLTILKNVLQTDYPLQWNFDRIREIIKIMENVFLLKYLLLKRPHLNLEKFLTAKPVNIESPRITFST